MGCEQVVAKKTFQEKMFSVLLIYANVVTRFQRSGIKRVYICAVFYFPTLCIYIWQ